MRDFNHTVGVLVKAYLNNTLEHGNCYACAVGNLIANAKNISFAPSNSFGMLQTIKWDGFISVYEQDWKYGAKDQPENWMGVIIGNGRLCMDYYNGVRKEFIDSTGYSVSELAKIEQAFEQASFGESFEDWMFNGLMAVVDVLAEIHGIDLKEREEAKALFVKA